MQLLLLLNSSNQVNKPLVLGHQLQQLKQEVLELLEQQPLRHNQVFLEDYLLQLRIQQEECLGSSRNNLKLRYPELLKDF